MATIWMTSYTQYVKFTELICFPLMIINELILTDWKTVNKTTAKLKLTKRICAPSELIAVIEPAPQVPNWLDIHAGGFVI